MGPKLDREIDYLNLAVVNAIAVAMEVEASLEVEIWEGQMEDPKFTKIWQLIRDNMTSDFLEES
jgi:hypothetical protein